MKSGILTKITVLLLCVAAVSCSQQDTGGAVPVDPDNNTAPTGETNAVSAYDRLPDIDYDGAEFTVVSPDTGTRYLPGQIMTTEETGDIIMDAAYIRNRNVEDYFNIELIHIPIAAGTYYGSLRTSILNGDSDYDLAAGFLQRFASLAVEPLFTDVSDLPYTDLSMPWYAKTNEALGIRGRQTLFLSDYTCITISCTYGMFYNYDLAAKFNINGLQETAFDGGWTIDKLIDYSKGVTADLNGDGILDNNDQYGNGFYFTVNNPISDTGVVFQYGMGQFTTAIGDSGEPELILNSERQFGIVEKLYNLYYGEDRSYLGTDGVEQTSMFASNRIMFFTCIIMHAPNYMRDMTDTYKVLPMPKYDEGQADYYTTISQTSSMIYGIPSTVSDRERASAVFDALSWEGYINVIPAFFEISMKVKYSRDELSSLMFDLLRNSTHVDFGLIFDGGVGMSYLVSSVLAAKNTDFASAYAKIKDKAIAQYRTVIDTMGN
ncbi:MAG: extracellular solute-binding protein [Eubacteriales bacterium]|nr:extracellular solute-binding protein [Eubacteriales bacterium]